MYKYLIYGLGIAILFYSCQQREVNDMATQIKLDTLSIPTVLPKNEIKFKRNLLYYYSILPIKSADVFSEISVQERKKLFPLNREDSAYITIESLDLGNYILKLILFRQSEAKDLVCLIEQIRNYNRISFYSYEPSQQIMVLNDTILPILDIPAAFFEENEIENLGVLEDNPPIFWSLNADMSLKAALDTWKHPAFEETRVPFDLFLYWKNDGFTIKKVERIYEEEDFDLSDGFHGKR